MSNADLTASTIREMIEQYSHRLQSLEVDLQEAARSNQVGVRDYERRVKLLTQLRNDIAEISQLNALESTDPFDANDVDLGLPITGNCTPTEISVCNEFLDQKISFTKGLEKNSRKVLDWVREAISEETPGYKTTWRLSRLRKMINQTDARTKLVYQESTMVDRYVEKLVRGLGKTIPKGVFAKSGALSSDALRGTIDGLMQVFNDLDRVISRVAKLRATVKQERQRITQMIHWLEVNELAVNNSRPATAPPSPLATARAMAEIPAVPGFDFKGDRRRLGLAKGFLNKMTRQEQAERSSDVEYENKLASSGEFEFDPTSILREIKKGKSAKDIGGLFE